MIRRSVPSLVLCGALCSSSLSLGQATRGNAVEILPAFARGHLTGLVLKDNSSGRRFQLQEAFVLVLHDKTVLRSSQMSSRVLDDPGSVIDPHEELRGLSERIPPTKQCWRFHQSTPSFAVDWCLIERPGTQYVRSLVRIDAGSSDLPIAEVRLLQFTDQAAHVSGSVQGSPVIDRNLFFGVEHPLSSNSVRDGAVTASIFRELPLRAGQSITYSAVVGTSPPGQLRRAFLAYLESERPRAYKPFLHYNSWYDIGYGNRYSEEDAIDRINAFGTQLVQKRHVQLDSFLFDDGWDNPNSLWGFNKGFPDGLAKTGAAAARYNAGIGVWLSPWGGYGEQKRERIAYGRAHGYEIMNDGYALSGSRYFNRFEQTCLEMIDKYHVNQFKFDGTGNANRVFPGSVFDSDFDAAIHLIERLRKEEPSLFVNLTTGTTASPFWVFYADSIWRGGEDHDFAGVGSPRQRWITYRDAQTYANIVRKGPLFPLNSLMLHGIIYAKQAKDLTSDPNNDFADEVHSYFGTGTQLQELYITPSLLSEADWDTLAEAARWSRAHAATLKDTHWIGGDPAQLEVYGWAAWSPRLGIITLRNPSDKPQSFTLNLARALELPPGAASAYSVHGVWNDAKNWQRNAARRMDRNHSAEIQLAPFEVLTLEASPIR